MKQCKYFFAIFIIVMVSCSNTAAKVVEKKAEKVLKIPSIGVAYAVGNRNDGGINTAVYNGLVALARDMHGFIRDDRKFDFGYKLDIRIFESNSYTTDREKLLRNLADTHCDLIIAVGFLYTDSVQAVSRDYPKTHFVLIDGVIPDLNDTSRITCINFNEHEGAFLLGAYAALLLTESDKTGSIGFLGGMDSPLIRRYASGFAAGAAFVEPKFRTAGNVLTKFTAKDSSGFVNPKAAYEMASGLYRYSHCEIIFHKLGAASIGLFEAAKELDKKALGADIDQAAYLKTSTSKSTSDLADVILMSMLKRVDTVIYSLGYRLMHDDKIAGGYQNYGLVEGGVSYSVAGISQNAMSLLSQITQGVISRDIIVPSTEYELETFIEKLNKTTP